MRLLQAELGQIAPLVNMGRQPGGVVAALSLRIQDDVDKGPVAALREQFALRAAVEKDIMKVQNAIRRIAEEQKIM